MLPSAPINKYEHKITHTVYDFSRTLSAFREPNRLRIGAGSPSKIIDIWRPKIPSKKLFEDHRFFLSM